MGFIYSLSILIIIATIFSYINTRFLKFPSTIGLMIITMVFSILLVLISNVDKDPLSEVYEILSGIDFTKLLMGGMLYLLLFAGAIQVNINDLKEQKVTIILFSSLSVIISTFVVGFLLYYVLGWVLPLIGVGLKIPLIYCLLFGALISPTDPVAVLSILKQANVNKALETKITGEALFNDGVAVILFTVIYNIAQGKEQVADITVASVSWLLFKEVFGALFAGFVIGYVGFHAIKTAFDDKLTILITLSVVISGYIVSQAMGISGPLTMVTAGLLIGNAIHTYSKKRNVSIKFIDVFWELIEDIMNAILFLLIGFELLLMPDLRNYWLMGIIAIIVVLVSRYISIKIPNAIVPLQERTSRKMMVILVWGGLRGGVSIALALSLAGSSYKEPIVAITYCVVVFAIIVQGLTVGSLAKRMGD